jgi:hypothetical protein
LLTTILADAINLGLTRMAESCPGTTYAKLSWLQAWHIRDETYSKALAELVNAQFVHPFAVHWGDGSTSSSDGQRFRAGGCAESTGHVNPKYGAEPGRMFYTHISDQYAPFHMNLVNVGVRDPTYVLDGLLYHESDLRIEEHYTDTSGFTDHVFALMHLLGFRFAPRIRDLGDTRCGPACRSAPRFPRPSSRDRQARSPSSPPTRALPLDPERFRKDNGKAIRSVCRQFVESTPIPARTWQDALSRRRCLE